MESEKKKMKGRIPSSLCSRSGLARIHVLLILACIVLLGMALFPWYKSYRYHGEWLACSESLRTVNGALVISMIDKGQTETLNEAATELLSILPGRESFCPSNGTVYFQQQEGGSWKAVCGKHESDHSLRARLNASYVRKRIQEEILRVGSSGEKLPLKLSEELNGETLECSLVTRETGIRRGTRTTDGVEGTVAYYGVKGSGMFSDAKTPAGELCYFCYADEDYCAVWRDGQGWSGNAYGDSY